MDQGSKDSRAGRDQKRSCQDLVRLHKTGILERFYFTRHAVNRRTAVEKRITIEQRSPSLLSSWYCLVAEIGAPQKKDTFRTTKVVLWSERESVNMKTCGLLLNKLWTRVVGGAGSGFEAYALAVVRTD